jgi:hypothetical protein
MSIVGSGLPVNRPVDVIPIATTGATRLRSSVFVDRL